ncbi:hypothetical protein AB835_13715 [Candidatus Endobugula sertula]|uniref:N-acetyltransferase domain-containing protein n=1 Tax=Candidatus Endobugula sertula TaxID=62101 RepID=A0A1D2QLS8_9GAMM|nr:hypothetical protein AB835_13715 [Candidatus Endobugula sertula]
MSKIQLNNNVTLLKNVLQTFEVLGTKDNSFTVPGFNYRRVIGWETPSFSINMLDCQHHLTENDLYLLKNFFYHTQCNPFINQTPYFTFLDDNESYNRPYIEAVCKTAGWFIDKRNLYLNYIDKILPVDCKDGLIISFQKSFAHEYNTLIKQNFEDNDNYLELAKSALNVEGVVSYNVFLKNRLKDIVGGGTVSVRGNDSFLTWGAINKPYRNLGYHQILLSACRLVAHSHGVKNCAYTTRNPLILEKADRNIQIAICRPVV